NVKQVIGNSNEQEFLLLIGRSHAYIHPIYGEEARLATMLIQDSEINVLTGVILFQNTVLMGGKKGKKPITLFEIKNKKPWKNHYTLLNKLSKDNFTVIPFKDSLLPLKHYTEYILIARNQETYKLR